LFAIVSDNVDSKEFFIQKASGWALREYAKIDTRSVEAFVKATPLAPLTRREALKHQLARFLNSTSVAHSI
jgi:3-methyladenine DNA glycosylase AlkD